MPIIMIIISLVWISENYPLFGKLLSECIQNDETYFCSSIYRTIKSEENFSHAIFEAVKGCHQKSFQELIDLAEKRGLESFLVPKELQERMDGKIREISKEEYFALLYIESTKNTSKECERIRLTLFRKSLRYWGNADSIEYILKKRRVKELEILLKHYRNDTLYNIRYIPTGNIISYGAYRCDFGLIRMFFELDRVKLTETFQGRTLYDIAVENECILLQNLLVWYGMKEEVCPTVRIESFRKGVFFTRMKRELTELERICRKYLSSLTFSSLQKIHPCDIFNNELGVYEFVLNFKYIPFKNFFSQCFSSMNAEQKARLMFYILELCEPNIIRWLHVHHFSFEPFFDSVQESMKDKRCIDVIHAIASVEDFPLNRRLRIIKEAFQANDGILLGVYLNDSSIISLYLTEIHKYSRKGAESCSLKVIVPYVNTLIRKGKRKEIRELIRISYRSQCIITFISIMNALNTQNICIADDTYYHSSYMKHFLKKHQLYFEVIMRQNELCQKTH